MTVSSIAPSPSQQASAALHLERRADWRTVRIDGTRYVILTSANSGRVYTVRADAAGCSCPWYLKTGQRCSHALALELDALESELFQASVDAALGPPAPKRASYSDLFPGCRDCGDPVDTLSSRCNRCDADAVWNARRDARAS